MSKHRSPLLKEQGLLDRVLTIVEERADTKNAIRVNRSEAKVARATSVFGGVTKFLLSLAAALAALLGTLWVVTVLVKMAKGFTSPFSMGNVNKKRLFAIP